MGKQRPGVLLYFSIRPCLKRLSLEEKGALFEGILDYAQHGVWPDFDGVLGVAWDFVVPLIDADAEAYKAKCEQAKRAIETRWAKQKEDTDVYGGMRPYTKDTNTNYNFTANNNLNNNDNSSGGDCKGEPHTVLEEKTLPEVKPMKESEFENRRWMEIERLKSWTG